MAQLPEQVTRTDRTVGAEYVETVISDPYAGRRGAAYKLQQAIYLLFGIIEGLIAIRFVLRALGAEPANGFAALVYRVTAPLIAPFVGLFGATPTFEGSALELHSLVAIVVYALLAWVLAQIARLALSETRAGVRTHTRSIDTEAR